MREEGGGGVGVRREENKENSFLGLEAEELILTGRSQMLNTIEVKSERRWW